MAADTPTIIHLGNPIPHRPISEGGVIVRREPLENPEPSVTVLHLSEEACAELREHADELEKMIGEEGLTAFSLRTVQQLEQEGPSDHQHEMFAAHLLHVVQRGHARAGFNWVSTQDAKLERALSIIFDAERAPKGTSAALLLAQEEGESWDAITAKLHGPTALKTKAGVKQIGEAAYGTTAQPAQEKFFALTANSEAASASNTTLAGEITTSEGGLLRKEATSWSFTESTGVGILACTLTANSHDTLPVTVEKFGVFNKVTSGGTMGIETKLSSSVALKEINDNITITETLTIT